MFGSAERGRGKQNRKKRVFIDNLSIQEINSCTTFSKMQTNEIEQSKIIPNVEGYILRSYFFLSETEVAGLFDVINIIVGDLLCLLESSYMQPSKFKFLNAIYFDEEGKLYHSEKIEH